MVWPPTWNRTEPRAKTAHWRSYEKAGGKPGTESYWNASKPIATNADGNIVYYVDGEAKVIEELEGLTPGGMSDRNFVITYNATQKEFADSPNGLWPYGKSYIWLNGKKKTLTFKAEKDRTCVSVLSRTRTAEPVASQ